jgi:hypothetical protein
MGLVLAFIAAPASPAAAQKPSIADRIASSNLMLQDEPVISVAYVMNTTNCFGNVGVFRAGTRILGADWLLTGDIYECFGIAPNRAIYHAWPRSVGWDPMPHNGRADDMTDLLLGASGTRYVMVAVNGKGNYCSHLPPGGQWSTWYRCALSA